MKVQLKYSVVDKTTNEIVGNHTLKMVAKEQRNSLQSKTKKGLPKAPCKKDNTDHRAIANNWSFFIRTNNE